jgi:hypothetical protein
VSPQIPCYGRRRLARPAPPPALSPTRGFWVAAATIVITLWTSAAPALAYPPYAAQWELTPTVTTALFAVYPAAPVVMLIVFGNVSDYTGRLPAILIGMLSCLLGSALFAIGPSIVWLFLGRPIMRIGVAFALSAATAAMFRIPPTAPGRAGQRGRHRGQRSRSDRGAARRDARAVRAGTHPSVVLGADRGDRGRHRRMLVPAA